jgi:beta-glucanase (GH16 family)
MRKMRTSVTLGIISMTALTSFAADWKLVWSDEFDKPGLPDPAKWTYEYGFVRNNEQQFYTRERKENARVENGVLIIEAHKERMKNPAYQPEDSGKKRRGRGSEYAEYTSASVITKGLASWTYGRVEVRAKLPPARGTWPAIWMLGTNINQVGWPACGEIDIMEFVGYNPGVIHANIHTAEYNHVKGTGKGSSIKLPDASEKFNVYAVEWFPDRMDFFVNDKKYFSYSNEKTGDDAWPYDKPHYLILNLALGGTWGGQKGIDESAFPQRFEIDYVRVYQR